MQQDSSLLISHIIGPITSTKVKIRLRMFWTLESLILSYLVGKLTIERGKNKRGREGFDSHQAIVEGLVNSSGILGFRKKALM